MKNPVLALFIFVFAFTSCRNDLPGVAPSQKQPVGVLPNATGKWQQVKIHLYEQDGAGAILYDTTYLKPFTGYDYLRFSTDSVTVGEDHYYYLNSPGYPKTPQLIPPQTSGYTYAAAGNKYILKSNSFANPGGFVVTGTLSTAAPNQLLLHSVFYAGQAGRLVLVTDSYYSR